MKLVLLGVVLLFSVAIARECTTSDYSGAYTQCDIHNRRMLLWYWKPGVDCTGGVPLPENKFNLPCDITCNEGYYLPLGETACVQCEPGSYSLGGGYRQESWSGDWQNGEIFQFQTYCTNLAGAVINDTTCGWASTPSGMLLQSANITNDQNSVLELPVKLLTAGRVHFVYRVNAEVGFDGMTFAVDGHVVLPLVSYTTGYFAEFQGNLTAGFHTLRWVYSKDYSLAGGDDAAFLQDPHCKRICNVILTMTLLLLLLLLLGTFSRNNGSSTCDPCPSNTVSVGQQSECTPCAANEYSLPGGEQCVMRPMCLSSSDVFQKLYTPCTANNSRVAYSVPLQPIVCDITRFPQPANQTQTTCPSCPDGTYRHSDGMCKGCSDPSDYYDGTACVPVPKGHWTERALYYFYDDSMDTWPTNWTTGCTGNCGTAGWRLRGVNGIDSGFHSFDLDNDVDSFVALDVQMESAGYVNFTYSSFPADATLEFFIDENPRALSSQGATITVPISLDHVTAPTRVRLMWNFHQVLNGSRSVITIKNIVIVGASQGALITPKPCAPGTFNDQEGHIQCSPCPVGYYNDTFQAEKCSPCAMGSFAASAGATTCITCGAGTFTNTTGSDRCSSNCLFEVPSSQIQEGNSPVIFSLAGLPSRVGPITDISSGRSFFLSLCDSAISSDICNSNNSYVCLSDLKSSAAGTNFGSYLTFLPNTGSGLKQGFSLQYSSGNICHSSGEPLQTTVTFVCDVDRQTATPELVFRGNSSCQASFVWSTIYGCPVCTDSDYLPVASECVDGEQSVLLVRQTNCNGPSSVPSSSLKCKDKVVFPIGWVVAGVAGFAVLGTITLALFIRHRKLSHQYERLLSNADHNIEMEDENEHTN